MNILSWYGEQTTGYFRGRGNRPVTKPKQTTRFPSHGVTVLHRPLSEDGDSYKLGNEELVVTVGVDTMALSLQNEFFLGLGEQETIRHVADELQNALTTTRNGDEYPLEWRDTRSNPPQDITLELISPGPNEQLWYWYARAFDDDGKGTWEEHGYLQQQTLQALITSLQAVADPGDEPLHQRYYASISEQYRLSRDTFRFPAQEKTSLQELLHRPRPKL